jgi:hypothetical protein
MEESRREIMKRIIIDKRTVLKIEGLLKKNYYTVFMR